MRTFAVLWKYIFIYSLCFESLLADRSSMHIISKIVFDLLQDRSDTRTLYGLSHIVCTLFILVSQSKVDSIYGIPSIGVNQFSTNGISNNDEKVAGPSNAPGHAVFCAVRLLFVNSALYGPPRR